MGIAEGGELPLSKLLSALPPVKNIKTPGTQVLGDFLRASSYCDLIKKRDREASDN